MITKKLQLQLSLLGNAAYNESEICLDRGARPGPYNTWLSWYSVGRALDVYRVIHSPPSHPTLDQ